MKISVNINGIFNKRFINESLELQFKREINLKDLIRKVGKILKNDIYKLITEKRSNPIILLNGKKVNIPEIFLIKIKDGDILSILQALGGG